MGTFVSLISQLDSDKYNRGREFERICKWYLENDPTYQFKLKQVWLWDKWPKRWGPDAGIDIVAEAKNGSFWAIQAKAYSETTTISKADVDTFLSESSRQLFSYRLLIATTDLISRNADRTLRDQEKPAHRVLLHDLVHTEINWPVSPDKLKAKSPTKKKPRPHQIRAIKDVCNGLVKHSRGQMLLACGTGKTLTSLWIKEKMGSSLTLVLVPSLSLLRQTLSEWSHNCESPFNYLAVCSDETVSHRGDDAAVKSTSELGVPVTTNIDEIRNFLINQDIDETSTIVFSTYQSSDRIASAQAGNSIKFNLIIADEAHRCAGHTGSLFTTVLDDSKIKGDKRLFMTATPRYFTGRVKKYAEDAEYEVASMDDESIFGPVLHKLSFGQAIQEDLLTDYQVAIIGVTEDDTRRMVIEGDLVRTKDGLETDARTLASQIGLAKAIQKYDLNKIITFHSSLRKARKFTSTTAIDSLPAVINRMSDDSKPNGKIWSSHIAGDMPAGKRAILLDALGNLSCDTRGIISNCACLSEGVDVPTLDGVAFIDPKKSMIDIIQAVGRVIRKADNKRIGTVVIPVFIDQISDAEAALSNSAFKPVWQVLKALKAHDDVFADELDGIRTKLGKRSFGSRKLSLPKKVQFDIPSLIFDDFEQALFVRTVEKTTQKPSLTIEQILEWADEHYERTGEWPNQKSDIVSEAPEETWNGINRALVSGLRKLFGGSSLAQLLEESRGVRNIQNLPPLTVKKILEWADFYYKERGKWPNRQSGDIYNTNGEKWSSCDASLIQGTRGLPGGSSLAKLLERHRGVVNIRNLPTITIGQLLEWADAHHEHTGEWPKSNSGRIKGTLREKWSAVSVALNSGIRGLPGNMSLAQLLEENRGVVNVANLPTLTEEQVLKWADMYYEKIGDWPKRDSGLVEGTNGEKWSAIDNSLKQGCRGFSGGSSLANVLEKHRGVVNLGNRTPLTIEKILEYADKHYEKTGKWPNRNSGFVLSNSKEYWHNIDASLKQGLRGLSGISSLANLLEQKREVINFKNQVPLTEEQILEWADKHYERTGEWPYQQSGEIHGVNKKWSTINAYLTRGLRGLPGESSLAIFLKKHRGVGIRHGSTKIQLTEEQILQWADVHYKKTGAWPDKDSGLIEGSNGEKWSAIYVALKKGHRGLTGSLTLPGLLKAHRNVKRRSKYVMFSEKQILKWVDNFHKKTGGWPSRSSGIIEESKGESWSVVDSNLKRGGRGLPGGSSLTKLIKKYRKK